MYSTFESRLADLHIKVQTSAIYYSKSCAINIVECYAFRGL